MKVLIVMPLGEALGGGEQMLRQLLQHDGGDITFIVVFLRNGPLVEETRKRHACHVVEAGRFRQPLRRLGAVRRIAQIARESSVDLVFGWMVAGQAMAGPAAMLGGKKCAWYQVSTPRPDFLDRFATLWPSRGVITLSKEGAAAQRRLGPRNRVEIVYPGVALATMDRVRDHAPRALRERLGLPADGPLVGIVGRLQRWKGIHVFIDALARVRKTNPQVRGVIVGGPHETEPGYADELRAQAAARGVAEAIAFAGFQKNAAEWMQAMDVVVHASDNEPFGIVVVEAMALGKPVVAGDSGGPREIISDGVNGLLAPYGDATRLGDAMLRLLGDRALSERLGAAARTRAADFSEPAYVANLTGVMRDFANA